MKLNRAPIKPLLTVLFLCKISSAQIQPIYSDPGPGILEKQSSIEYNYNLAETQFLQSSGILGVVENDPSGAAWMNPATLGLPDEKWAHGDAAFHSSYLAPQLNLEEYVTDKEATYQQGSTGISLEEQDYNFGPVGQDSSSSYTPIAGYTGSEGHAWDLSIGHRLNGSGFVGHNVGIGLKYVLAPPAYGNDGERRNGYLMNLGYLGAFENGFRMGVSLQNLGWGIHGIKSVTLRQDYTGGVIVSQYYAQDSSFSLTPVTATAGVGFQRSLVAQNIDVLEATLSAAYSREFKQGELGAYSDDAAGELGLKLLNTITAQFGLLHDSKNATYSFKEAYGLNLIGHLSLGYGVLISHSGFYDAQRFFSVELYNLLSYRSTDWTWWRKAAL